MTTIREVFGLDQVTAFASRHAIDADVVEPNRPVGVEIELEGLNPSTEFRFPGFHFETDGSLRSDENTVAMEAITQPVPINAVKGLLDVFYKKFGITERNFSERCSIHVHFNVLDLTVEQLASICLVYQTVERLLFTFVDKNRSQSIFCVPWYQSGLTYNYVNSIIKEPARVRNWQKYTALNLNPASVQGTIEFRHMQGCADVGTIYQWIRIIARMFQYAQSKPFDAIRQELLEMNTVSNYRQWLELVFQAEAGLFYGIPDFEKALFRGVVDSKYMLTKDDKQTRVTQQAPTLDELLRGNAVRWDRQPEPERQVYDPVMDDYVEEVVNARQPPVAPQFIRTNNVGLNTIGMWNPVEVPAPQAPVNTAAQQNALEQMIRLEQEIIRDRARGARPPGNPILRTTRNPR